MRKVQQGFTLIEVMVVIVILGLLAVMVVPKIMGSAGKAKIGITKTTLSTVASALDRYKLDNNKYPATDEGLKALVEAPASAKNWQAGGYVSGGKNGVKDAWGNELQYIANNNGTYELYSFGADGLESGEDENADIYLEQ